MHEVLCFKSKNNNFGDSFWSIVCSNVTIYCIIVIYYKLSNTDEIK